MDDDQTGTKGRGRAVMASLAFMAILGGGGAYWYSTQAGDEPQPVKRAPVPVSVATAVKQDLPIYLSGLGTVQALFTVAIHSQIDGTLQEVLFTEGERVNKGDVLAKIDPRLFQAAFDQVKAKKAEDDAQLIAAEKDLVRFKSLVAKNFETQQNVDLQVAKVDQLKASIDADMAAIETAQTQLDYTVITAPNDGRIGVRLVDPGNVVHASDQTSIATLVMTQPSAILFSLPAKVLDDVRDAMVDRAIEVTALDRDNEQVLSTGKLLTVDNVIDPATSSFRLKAMFANDDERLWPGEFVNARLLLESRRNIIAMPSTAIQEGPTGLFAWVIDKDNTADVRAIKIGPSTGGLTIITSGLNDGDRVVTDGQFKLDHNSPVTIIQNPAPAS